MTRLVAVCGYSDRAGEELNAICAARLRRAELETGPDDVVLLTGWARHGTGVSEAALMAAAWDAPCREVIVDEGARSTVENVRAAARVAGEVGATEIVLVTSGWHGGRAGALLRASLRDSGPTVRLATTDERPSAGTRLREPVCWTAVPLVRLSASASRR